MTTQPDDDIDEQAMLDFLEPDLDKKSSVEENQEEFENAIADYDERHRPS